MPVPTLTPEQRKVALQKSLEVRKARAVLKEDIKAGKKSFSDVLKSAKDDNTVGRMKVLSLLQSLPGVGKAKALAAMEEIGIAETRRAQGLGLNQINALIERFGK